MKDSIWIKTKVKTLGRLEPLTIIASRGDSDSPVSLTIKWWERRKKLPGKYSHVDIVLSTVTCGDDNLHVLIGAQPDGVRLTTLKKYWRDGVDFDAYRIRNLTTEEKLKGLRFLENAIYTPYDYRGIARFVIPGLRANQKRYFCSELLCRVLIDIGRVRDVNPETFMPDSILGIPGILEKINK